MLEIPIVYLTDEQIVLGVQSSGQRGMSWTILKAMELEEGVKQKRFKV